LNPSIVFAVTRTLEEAALVERRADSRLVWGCGVHPGRADALKAYDADRFRSLLPSFVLVGEVGLDRRAGHLELQRDVLRDILLATSEGTALVSLHSSGAQALVVEHLEERPLPGAILHWFTGSRTDVRRAISCGAFFSVNSAMHDAQLELLPPDRILPETDFPNVKRAGVRRPGDIDRLESRLGDLRGETREKVRRRWYENLRTVAASAGIIERLPEALIVPMLAA
jgi:TatD DNase family protein